MDIFKTADSRWHSNAEPGERLSRLMHIELCLGSNPLGTRCSTTFDSCFLATEAWLKHSGFWAWAYAHLLFPPEASKPASMLRFLTRGNCWEIQRLLHEHVAVRKDSLSHICQQHGADKGAKGRKDPTGSGQPRSLRDCNHTMLASKLDGWLLKGQKLPVSYVFHFCLPSHQFI